MKTLKIALCAAAASFAMAGAASAAEVAFNAGVANSYVFRGVKQTAGFTGDDDMQVFGGADVTIDQFYVGTWLSNVGFGADNGVEYDIYAGWKPTLGPVAVDLGLIYYGFTDSDLGTITDAANTVEVKVAGSIAAGPATLGAAVFYTDDAGGTGFSQFYYELNGSFPVGDRFTISGAIGSVDSDAPGSDYTTSNIGITIPVADKLSLDVRGVFNDTDAQAIYAAPPFYAEESAFVATLKVTF